MSSVNSTQVQDNITLISQPPYSPQLNQVERLWHYLRQYYWYNRVYADYHAMKKAVIDAWHRVCLNPINIKSICKTTYVQNTFI